MELKVRTLAPTGAQNGAQNLTFLHKNVKNRDAGRSLLPLLEPTVAQEAAQSAADLTFHDFHRFRLHFSKI